MWLDTPKPKRVDIPKVYDRLSVCLLLWWWTGKWHSQLSQFLYSWYTLIDYHYSLYNCPFAYRSVSIEWVHVAWLRPPIGKLPFRWTVDFIENSTLYTDLMYSLRHVHFLPCPVEIDWDTLVFVINTKSHKLRLHLPLPHPYYHQHFCH